MADGPTPAGWYPDPGGQFQSRYWDGSRWTEHVASGGRQGTAPVVAPGAAAAMASPFGTVYFDQMVSARIRGRHRLVLGDQALAWDAEVLPYDQVTAFMYDHLTVTTNVTATTTYQSKVWAGPRMVHVVFMGGARDDATLGVYRLLVRVLADYVAPGLVGKLRDKVLAGEGVEIGHVALDQTGVHRKALGRRKDFTWPEVAAAIENGDELGLRVPPKTANGALLPAVLRACAAALTG